MRLIDADELKTAIGELRLDFDFCIPYDESTIRDFIDDAPTIKLNHLYEAAQEIKKMCADRQSYEDKCKWCKFNVYNNGECAVGAYMPMYWEV